MARNYPDLRQRALRFLEDKTKELGLEPHPVDAYLSAAMRVLSVGELPTFAKNYVQTLRKTLSLQDYGMLSDKAPAPKGDINLAVPFWQQTDNYRDGTRTCFSSSMAMVVEFLSPEKLKGDDDYVRTVFSIGDTTDPNVQVKSLAKYGIEGTYRQNMDFADLDKELEAGYPIGIGILHRGPLTSPSGGHWIVCIGKNANGSKYKFNDPYGSLTPDAYTGPVENGNGVWYDRHVLEARWTCEGKNSGWGMTCRKAK